MEHVQDLLTILFPLLVGFAARGAYENWKMKKIVRNWTMENPIKD